MIKCCTDCVACEKIEYELGINRIKTQYFCHQANDNIQDLALANSCSCYEFIINEETKDEAQIIDLREFNQKQMGMNEKYELQTLRDMFTNAMQENAQLRSENKELKFQLKIITENADHVCFGELPY